MTLSYSEDVKTKNNYMFRNLETPRRWPEEAEMGRGR
jgi:hypothetical protein